MKQSEAEKAYWENKKDDNAEYYNQISREHAENMKRWIAQSPEDKAKRSWECMGKTQYMLRNGFKEPNEQRVELIKKRLKDGFILDQLKQAVDNFVQDDWEGRSKMMDLVYCIGVRNKIDNLEKWLNYKPKTTIRRVPV